VLDRHLRHLPTAPAQQDTHDAKIKTNLTESYYPGRPEQQPAEDVILGVDTHKDVHVAAVITVLGALLAHQEFPATAAGYRQLLA
ncbi:hypothetical protein ACFU9Y_41235, partial [Streptomyces sp. NPDC057621]